jgi:hypothetical protein
MSSGKLPRAVMSSHGRRRFDPTALAEAAGARAAREESERRHPISIPRPAKQTPREAIAKHRASSDGRSVVVLPQVP